MQAPVTDDDWKIHALNVHGNFFQNKVAQTINTFNPQRLRFITTEYPVEYPRDHSREESRLDVLGFIPAQHNYQSGIYLIIECKKANPEFIDWLFYPTVQNQLFDPNHSQITVVRNTTVNKTQQYDEFIAELGLTRGLPVSNVQISGDCREVRGSYENVSKGIKTKTSNATITDASYQVVLATHSIASDHRDANTKLLDENSRPVLDRYLYMPMIVTTANLFTIEYNLDDVDISSGEIPLDKVTLKPADMVFYEYPIPPHLQIVSDTKYIKPYDFSMDYRVRRYILIANAKCLDKALNWMIRSGEWLIGS